MLVLQWTSLLGLLALVVNLMTASVSPAYKLSVMNASNGVTVSGDKQSVTSGFGGENVVNFKVFLRVHHAIFGWTTDWLNVSVRPDPAVLVPLLDPAQAGVVGTGPAYDLRYTATLSTRPNWPQSCTNKSYDCAVVLRELALVSNTTLAAGASNTTTVQFVSGRGQFFWSEISIGAIVLVCLIVAFIWLGMCRDVRWNTLDRIARGDGKARPVREE